MDGRTGDSDVLVLPRLVRGHLYVAAVGNAAGLLATALVGAGLVHLLAYHRPAGTPLDRRWAAQALILLLKCPLAGPLGLIGGIAIAALLLTRWKLQRLERLNTAAGRLLIRRHLPLPLARQPSARSFRRLAALFGLLLYLQVALVMLAGWLDPMKATMVMGGRIVTMTATPGLVLVLLHVMVTALLALFLWRVEHRLTQARAAAALLLRVLIAACTNRAVLPISSRSACLPCGWDGLALFARPPPCPS